MTKFIAALLIGSMIGISISFASSSDKFTIYGTQDNIKVTLTPDGAPEMNLEGLIKFDLRIADDPKVLDEARHSKVSVTVRDLSLIVFAFPYSVIASNHINLQSTVGLGGLSFRPGATILLTQDSVKDLKGDIPLEMPLPTKGPQIKEVDELDYLETSTRFQKGLLSLRLEFEKPTSDLVSEGKVVLPATLSGSLRVDPVTFDGDSYSGYSVEIPATPIEVYSANLSKYVATKKLCLQPISIRSDSNDATPTGKNGTSFVEGLTHAKKVWGKIGNGNTTIVFVPEPGKTIENAELKQIELGEGSSFPTELTRKCISVFLTEKIVGGSKTYNSGTETAYVLLSDEVATSDNGKHVLAHELGHVMRLAHPGSTSSLLKSSPGTIACGGDPSENRNRNSMENIGSASNPYLFPDSEQVIFPNADCDDGGTPCGTCAQ